MTMSHEEKLAKRRAAYAAGNGVREYNAEWKRRNRERVREVNRESAKRAYATPQGKARIDANKKRWCELHPDQQRDIQRAWHAKNPNYNKEVMQRRYNHNPAYFLLNNCRQRARKKGLPFSINLDDVVIPEICPVLGLPLTKQGAPFHPNSPSVDKIVPELGYVPGNVAVISWRANCLKRDGTLDEFRKIVAYMERQ